MVPVLGVGASAKGTNPEYWHHNGTVHEHERVRGRFGRPQGLIRVHGFTWTYYSPKWHSARERRWDNLNICLCRAWCGSTASTWAGTGL